MEGQNIITQIKIQLFNYGFFSSAMACTHDGQIDYIGWHKQSTYIEDASRLAHLGAMVRMLHDSDQSPQKVPLDLGEPNKPIV